MVKVKKDRDTPSEVSPREFEEMMEQMWTSTPQEVAPGEIVTGKIVSIGKEWAFIDIGAKAEAIISMEELLNDKGDPIFKVGDTIEATVLTTRGEIRLSRSLRKKQQTEEFLTDAYHNKIPVEGRIVETKKGGFTVDLGAGKSAFCPISQIDLKFVENPDEYVGRTFKFRILEMSWDFRNIVLSRRILLEEQQKARAEATKEKLKQGITVTGVVTRIMPYGCFVDLGGIDGLVHVSEMAWDRIDDPSLVVTQGQEVKVKVLSIDPVQEKIALSMKQAEKDPWEDIQARYPPGRVVSGTVTRVETYGAFVRLEPGVEGLVHISEMSWARNISKASELVNVGDKIQVAILEVDVEKRRIALGMKQLQENPWDSVMERYTVEKEVIGTVSRIVGGGVLVELDHGLMGFVPASLSGLARGQPISSRYEPGAKMAFIIREIEPEKRRLILEATDIEAKEAEQEFEKYKTKAASEEQPIFGTLGELIKQAMSKKNRSEK